MATYLFRINWQWDDALVDGGDTIVWGYHVDALSSAGLLSTLVQEWESVAATLLPSTTLLDLLPSDLEVESYQLYDVVNGGPPVDEVLPVAPVVGAGAPSGPSEVQVVVSRWVADGLGRPFKKGRQYIGPLSGSVTDVRRPPVVVTQTALNATVAFHEALTATNITPVVDTKGALHVPEDIVQYSVDNAWDTQRRRGLEPTSELVGVPA